MTNYELIVNEIISDKKRLSMFLAYVENPNDWPMLGKLWEEWLDEETKFNLAKLDDDIKKFIK